jgi:hypothetical protein
MWWGWKLPGHHLVLIHNSDCSNDYNHVSNADLKYIQHFKFLNYYDRWRRRPIYRRNDYLASTLRESTASALLLHKIICCVPCPGQLFRDVESFAVTRERLRDSVVFVAEHGCGKLGGSGRVE